MGAKILYIEDNPGNRMLVRRILLVEDYDVFEAEDGPTGIEIALREKPDLILMDMNLPDLDGYELTKRMRAIPELTGIPIIAMTANVMQGDREKTLAAGCSGYIPKPIDVDELPLQIARFLKASGYKGDY
ncbi:MAG TPA: response regulator [Anaerolineae bacterium]|nr:response regulator [Anaerolineae bacterium]HQI83981.1 response regulator [Anaerolineae bacterium]